MWSDGDRLWLERVARNLIYFNLLGLPAVVVPAGRTDDGRPLAVQIVGRPLEDRTVLSVAASIQAATDHHRSAPSRAHQAMAAV
jgi:aspartyl-tRNA(Asn)/glutamyl-tRNA(Gln) amidotransferase subunit A